MQKERRDKDSLWKLEVAESTAGLITVPIFTLSTVQATFKATLKDISTFLRVR